uniref:Uncharacterized protein n=1 Tax=Rhizophagus irregularis (strain DAOM 181602 / DAOM 197198 / MUCL 43194) TaxID=747089 RepID=U9SRU0_RHIID
MNHLSRSTKVSKSVSKRVQIDNNDDETSNTSSNSSGSSNSSTSESQEPIHILTKRERKEKFKVVESAVNDVLIDELDNEDTGFSSPIDNDQKDFGDNEDFMCTNDAGRNRNISSCDETEIYSAFHFKFQNSEYFVI